MVKPCVKPWCMGRPLPDSQEKTANELKLPHSPITSTFLFLVAVSQSWWCLKSLCPSQGESLRFPVCCFVPWLADSLCEKVRDNYLQIHFPHLALTALFLLLRHNSQVFSTSCLWASFISVVSARAFLCPASKVLTRILAHVLHQISFSLAHFASPLATVIRSYVDAS